MPSIEAAIAASKKLSGTIVTPVPATPVQAIVNATTNNQSNAYMRCPLPPFAATPDDLKNYNSGPIVPKLRVVPVPLPTGGTTTIIENGGSSASGGSSSSGGSTVPTTAQSVVIQPGTIVGGDTYTTSVALGDSYVLISITASDACDVRFYGTNAALIFDMGRAIDQPVPPEITQNIITDVILDTAPYQWDWQNVVGTNQDVPQTKNLYISIVNTDPINSINPTITVVYLPL